MLLWVGTIPGLFAGIVNKRHSNFIHMGFSDWSYPRASPFTNSASLIK
jgi:hypothetical protein